jgi:hypothetical protein
MAIKSSIGQISVTTSRKQLFNSSSNNQAAVKFGVRLRADSSSAKVYFGDSSVTTSNGYLINNTGDQIAAGSFEKLSDIYLIADGTVTVTIELVGQDGITIQS